MTTATPPGSPGKSPPARQPTATIVLVAVAGVLAGVVFQEFRLRNPTPPNGNLELAEKAFQSGDNQTALDLFSKLANQNNPNAEYWLAHMSELGLGVARDPQKSLELYKKAAAQNLVAAELRLGQIYLHGDLVPPDFAQAKTYLEKAAYQGNDRAAMLLGQMYRIGLGMSADLKQAYAWSEVATIEGSTFAKRERDASLHDLSESDQKAAIAQAQDILKEIKPTTAPQVPKSK
jgi:TPR repeat protein